MRLLTLPLLIITGFSSCSQPYEIDRQYVEAVITDLSSDDLKGRAVFTPEIDKAADYIANSFQVSGLQTLAGLAGYKQIFVLYSVKVKEANVVMDGEVLSADNFFLRMDDEFLNWTKDSDIIVATIGKEDNFREEMSRISRNDDDLLVIIDPVHADMFNRYKRFYSRGSNVFDLGKSRNLVFVNRAGDLPKDFTVEASATIEERQLTNVVATIPGKRTDEQVVFSAHYDHIGIRPTQDGDSIANGANDDASGVAAVLALGKYFAGQPQPERTLVFVAFTAEESGGYGSQYFSRQLDPDQIMAMFNIEMIGKPSKNGANTAWITGWDKSDFGELLQNSVEGSIYSFYPDPYPTQNLFYRSDNATLARLGVPAHSISTTQIDIDEDYHQVSDEVETLDLDHLTNTVKAIATGATEIISGESTPTRVDPTGL